MTVNISYDEDSSVLKTEVKDTGIGIKPEDMVKLFRFFGTISKSKDINRGGMGLGLTISKLIVNKLGGEISLESTPNQGSTFSFYVPIENEDLFLQTSTIIQKSPELGHRKAPLLFKQSN